MSDDVRVASASVDLTSRQRAIVDYVTECYAANGQAPTMREIAARVGLRSPNAVSEQLRRLESKGVVLLRAKRARGIGVVRKARAIAAWKAENASLRALLQRVADAGDRLRGLNPEMATVLGDVRDALAAAPGVR